MKNVYFKKVYLDYYIGVLLLLVGLVGCTNEDERLFYTSQEEVGIQFSRQSNLNEENEIRQLDALLFTPDGSFQEAYRNLAVEGNQCKLNLRYQDKSHLVFLANIQELLNLDSLTEKKVSLQALRELTVSVGKDNRASLFMTGELTLSSQAGPKEVTLVRGVARIDLVASPEVKVYELSVHGLTTESYLLPQSAVKTHGKTYDLVLSSQAGEILSKSGLAYVWEQEKSEKAVVEAKISIAGVNHVVRQVLPAFERNKIYTIRIKGSGIDAGIEISENEWEEGDVSEALPSEHQWISELHSDEGVTQEGNTVVVPHFGTQQTSFLLKVEDGCEIDQLGGKRKCLWLRKPTGIIV